MRQAIINGAVGGFMGYAAQVAWDTGSHMIAICILPAWLIGMINSIISK